MSSSRRCSLRSWRWKRTTTPSTGLSSGWPTESLRRSEHPNRSQGWIPPCLSTWQLELDICERVARQLRCVGDALAWRVFGFERQYITALARNQSPGMMAGKLGFAAERARVEQARREYGQFALMYALTNCLRIGDITAFTDEGPVQIEVKTNGIRSRRELANALPGPDSLLAPA